MRGIFRELIWRFNQYLSKSHEGIVLNTSTIIQYIYQLHWFMILNIMICIWIRWCMVYAGNLFVIRDSCFYIERDFICIILFVIFINHYSTSTKFRIHHNEFLLKTYDALIFWLSFKRGDTKQPNDYSEHINSWIQSNIRFPVDSNHSSMLFTNDTDEWSSDFDFCLVLRH